ncbi:unnamed protein product, partial [Notodromas monacha]
LRFFTVYGPWGRPDMALFLFTKAIIENQPIQVFNHGQMQRDFTYIDDIIEGVVRVNDHPPKGNPLWDGKNPDPSQSKAPYQIYNIGNNSPVLLMDFIETLEKKLGKVAKKEFLPLQAGDVPSTVANVDDLVRDLNYQPNTSIEYGIGQFVDCGASLFKNPHGFLKREAEGLLGLCPKSLYAVFFDAADIGENSVGINFKAI